MEMPCIRFQKLGASISRNIQALAMTVFSKTTNCQQDISQPMIGEVQTVTVGGTNTAGLGYDSEHPGLNQLSDLTSQPGMLGSRRRSASAPPIADVSIPSLSRAPGAWRRALKQWTEVDPYTGLALKDWPTKWYKGLMKNKTASLQSQRQVIFEEYEQ